MKPITGYYNTFVVKIWCDEGKMRGHIQHVSTQEQVYFLSLENMTDFIVSRLNPPPNDSVTQDKAQSGLTLVGEDFRDFGYDA